MTQILPHLLWIGHAGDGRDYSTLHDVGIRAIVQLALEEPALEPPRAFLYYRFPLLDGSGNDARLLSVAINTLTHLAIRHSPTLVCCGAGMSRSPAVVAAVLARLDNEPPAECLKRVTEHHSSDISPALWQDILECVTCRL